MVQRHLAFDKRLLEWAQTFQESARDQPLFDEHLLAREFVPLLEELMQLDDAEWDALPQWQRQFLNGLVEFDEIGLQHQQEIAIMQARLQERFPGYDFPLPELTGQPSETPPADGMPVESSAK